VPALHVQHFTVPGNELERIWPGSVMKGVGVRLSPSPIYFIVVIVKKDHLCVAQVIFATSDNAEAEAALHFGRPHIRERRGRVQGGEEDHQAIHDPHTRRSRLIPSSALR